MTRQQISGKDYNLVKCDLTNHIELTKIIEDVSLDVIYHFAALTNPKRNENNPKEAKLANVGITKNLIETNDLDETHFFLSTDKVFDGSSDCPDETSVTNPLWEYGNYKLDCEKIIGEKMNKFHIIRLPIVHAMGENTKHIIH